MEKENDKNRFNIDKEIELKRFDPDFLIKFYTEIIEKYEKEMRKSDFSEIIAYRRKFSKWKKQINEPVKEFGAFTKELTRETDKILKLTEQFKKNLDRENFDVAEDIGNKIDEIVNKRIEKPFEFRGWTKEDFSQLDSLIFERETLLSKNKVGTFILNVLFKNGVMETFSTILKCATQG